MKFIHYIIVITVMFTSCNYLDVEPVGKVIPDEVSEFRAMLTTAYGRFPQHKRLLTMRSDEVTSGMVAITYDAWIDIVTWNDESPDPVTYTFPWTQMYNVIFYANSVIEDVMDAGIDDHSETREQLKGEALLLRAYAHFELLNMYAEPYDAATASSERGVPLYLTIDINQAFKPVSIEKVYDQILSDIEEGEKLMTVEEQPAATRYRFSKKSAKALEARVRLYRGEWDKALAAAEAILPSCPLENFTVEGFSAPYLYTSKESILALEQTGNTEITDDMEMLSNIMDKYDQSEDLRVNLYYRNGSSPNKCYNASMKITFRSAEIYLIAAEAASHITGKISDAKAYLKTLIRNRLTDSYYTERAGVIDAMTQEELIAEIADERARELALEGHRWYDLRRTTRPEIVKVYWNKNFEQEMVTLPANSSKYTIPFPTEAITNNPNLNEWDE
ncbi:RagB/SusD family nutrient uptake outer membrane protein [Butyricimonas sp. Marseille-P3923]|uniref:RagB/SusD family nutrient uptake outer membrane protein n=1 Tax=Butyricimonas sp. Marseille-P3923 TaxID=1987504 RepID=UPI002100422C|nr:RagB/SusD family nutrient uptake outer membrane protein [Butyricimonas sp. Marseille-P3923]